MSFQKKWDFHFKWLGYKCKVKLVPNQSEEYRIYYPKVVLDISYPGWWNYLPLQAEKSLSGYNNNSNLLILFEGWIRCKIHIIGFKWLKPFCSFWENNNLKQIMSLFKSVAKDWTKHQCSFQLFWEWWLQSKKTKKVPHLKKKYVSKYISFPLK